MGEKEDRRLNNQNTSSFSVRLDSLHLLLSSGRSSYFRMVFCSFHFLPIFLLAQILMRADLGDEPEHPLEVVISNPPGQDATRTPQLTGNVGQRSLHSARISEETRTADTATLCQTQKASRYASRTHGPLTGGETPKPLDQPGSLPLVGRNNP